MCIFKHGSSLILLECRRDRNETQRSFTSEFKAENGTHPGLRLILQKCNSGLVKRIESILLLESKVKSLSIKSVWHSLMMRSRGASFKSLPLLHGSPYLLSPSDGDDTPFTPCVNVSKPVP